MSRQIQIRRGSATEHQNFTGAVGEITMDTTNNTLRVHDGETAGGTMLARKSELPPASADYVIETQLPTAENNYSWYRLYKSGWVEQGGEITAASVADGTGSSGNNSIILPVIMANEHYHINLQTQVGSSGWDYANGVILNSRSTTKLTLKVLAGTGSIPLFWEVSGLYAE